MTSRNLISLKGGAFVLILKGEYLCMISLARYSQLVFTSINLLSIDYSQLITLN